VPVYFLVMASFINIGLDLLFILVFHMGVVGAALATVISQFVSGVGCLVFMIKKYDFLRTSRDERKFRGRYALKLCSVGIPMGLQYSITAIGSIVLQSSVNTLGSLSVSAMATANKVGMFFSSSFYIPLAFVNIVRFLIQGMGASNLAVIAGVCEMVARAGVGFLLVPKYGFTAACIASPIAWVLADMFLFPAYFYVLRKLKRIVK